MEVFYLFSVFPHFFLFIPTANASFWVPDPRVFIQRLYCICHCTGQGKWWIKQAPWNLSVSGVADIYLQAPPKIQLVPYLPYLPPTCPSSTFPISFSSVVTHWMFAANVIVILFLIYPMKSNLTQFKLVNVFLSSPLNAETYIFDLVFKCPVELFQLFRSWSFKTKLVSPLILSLHPPHYFLLVAFLLCTVHASHTVLSFFRPDSLTLVHLPACLLCLNWIIPLWLVQIKMRPTTFHFVFHL